MARTGRAVVVCAVVAAAFGMALLAPVGGTVLPAADGLLQENGADVSPDQVVVRIDVLPDGTARWQVDYRIRLEEPNRTAAFEDVRRNVTEHPLRYAGRFRERQRSAVATGENATGREMALRNVTVTALRQQPAGLPSEYGVLRYRFEWAAFGARQGGKLRVGDALRGFFLREDWMLVVSWPENYRAVQTTPSPDERRERAAVWRGPTEFATGGPQVVLEPTGGPGLRFPELPVLVAAGALALTLLAVGWYRRGEPPLPGLPGSTDGPPDAAGESAAAAGETGDGGGATAGEMASTPAQELLSDEERVVRLLEEHGGRMKQQEVVEALDWSETKTSQVVTELHEAGTIERYRLGRENVLALPGEIDV